MEISSVPFVPARRPAAPTTLVELLRRRAAEDPHLDGYTFLLDGESAEAKLTYAELDRKARAIAATLQARGAEGERALLLYAPGLDYVAALFGCFYAGVVAVPVYPPDMSRPGRTLPRLAAIAADSTARFALTTGPILAMVQYVCAAVPELAGLTWLATDDATGEDDWEAPMIGAEDLAFLQYTSGSTATPKGVMLTHANLLHNLRSIASCFGVSRSTRGVIWLPPYHDMGLIGGVLQPIYAGIPVVLLSPLDFLKKPVRWLQAITKYGGTCSGGPNFAYDLCARKATESERAALDLSTWELAFNGAEPIRPDTLRRFVDAFGPCGFRAEAFYPCYGLAEGTLIATGGRKSGPTKVHSVDAEALRAGKIVPAADGARQLVACGQCIPDQRLVIAHPETGALCGPGEVGEIWLAGPSIARGYWGRPEQSERTFGARVPGDPRMFLRTGDLGALDDEGALLVTGRLKDLIILRGRNHYPQDIERTAERCHPALRPGCSAAFAVGEGGEEALAIVLEVDARGLGEAELDAIVASVRAEVAADHEVRAAQVVLLEAGSIPKTSSGKIQRHACKAELFAGTLEVVRADRVAAEAEATPVQVDRAEVLAASGALRRDRLVAWLRQEAARALGVPTASVDPARSLYAVGLDSLAAVELRSAVEEGLGVELPLTGLLQDAPLATLADALLPRLGDAADDAAAERQTATPDPVEGPVSSGQRALWLMQQLAPESAAWHVPVAVRITSPLDIYALRRTFARIVARHPALRTTFALGAEGVIQRVRDDATIDFTVRDADEATLSDALARDAARPFDLENGPLCRVSLYRVGSDHVLLWTMHHAITDFWSIAVLAEEIDAIYPAERDGRDVTLPSIVATPASFARWQHALLDGPRGAALVDHWKTVLAGELPVVDLPADRPRPPVARHQGAVHAVRLDRALAGKLEALGRASGATLNVTLLAAFQALLHRRVGQEDLVVGTVGAGRTRPEQGRIVGYTVNPLPIRTRPTAATPFARYLAETRDALLAALDHQDLPFEALVDRLRPARDASRSPLFDVLFVYQKSPRLADRGLTALGMDLRDARAELGGLTLRSVALPHATSQFDLTLTMGEVDGGLVASFEYDTDLFDAATIERLAGQLETLLRGVADDPARTLGELPILTPAEERAALDASHGETIALPPGSDVPTRFAAQAALTPDAPALVVGGETLSYADLAARVDAIAAALAERGIGAGSLVALALGRSVDAVAGVLGAWRAGAAYVPVDPAWPAERIALVLGDAGATIALVRGSEGVPVPGGVLDLETVGRGGQDLPFASSADALACVLYTSGSTGTPKGVMLTHGGLANLVASFVRSYDAGPADRMLPLTSIASASFLGEILPLLCVGGCVVLPSDEETVDVDRLLARIRRDGVTIASTVPSLLATLDAHAADLGALRLVLSGGEALAAKDVSNLAGRVAIVNGYGLTETTVCATFQPVGAAELATAGWVPVGRPIPNTSVYVLDAAGRVQPAGVPGEIWVGGAAVAAGYWRRPELTDARFRPDPFRGGKMYRTGDLGRRQADGSLVYLHRVDDQVKIRGHRVELGEVEAALRQHPEVRDAFVAARVDGTGQRRLVAWFVGETDGPTLRAFLAERLPSPLVPAAFARVGALPRNANGKVDAGALPAPEAPRAVSAPPRGAMERRIADILCAVLDVPEIGTRDNFFDLGANSLLLAKAHRRLKDELAMDLPLVELFRHTTVESLAARLGRPEAPAQDNNRLRDEAARRREALARRQRPSILSSKLAS